MRDASGFVLPRIYCCDDLQKYTHGHTHLNSEEARRIASAVAMIPELMMPAEFAPRGQGVRCGASMSSSANATPSCPGMRSTGAGFSAMSSSIQKGLETCRR